ncbi:hypothetical protein KW785_03535 [Candidatus Parcubacteria bacterium]|nr:hypothetical protein [Candidatus Parcubacteria bacterium]
MRANSGKAKKLFAVAELTHEKFAAEALREYACLLAGNECFTEEPTAKDWERIDGLPWGSRLSTTWRRNSVTTEEMQGILPLLKAGKGREVGSYPLEYHRLATALNRFFGDHAPWYRVVGGELKVLRA